MWLFKKYFYSGTYIYLFSTYAGQITGNLIEVRLGLQLEVTIKKHQLNNLLVVNS